VGNALLTGVRRSRWNGTDADRMFAVVRRMPVRLVDDDRDIDRAWELSRRYDEHPLYDMVYVAVAERLGETFVTADAQLLTRLQQLSYVVGQRRAGAATPVGDQLLEPVPPSGEQCELGRDEQRVGRKQDHGDRQSQGGAHDRASAS